MVATEEHFLEGPEETRGAGAKVVEETVAGVKAVVATAVVLMAVRMVAGKARWNMRPRYCSRLSTRGSRLI